LRFDFAKSYDKAVAEFLSLSHLESCEAGKLTDVMEKSLFSALSWPDFLDRSLTTELLIADALHLHKENILLF
jgi:hypothetical protein